MNRINILRFGKEIDWKKTGFILGLVLVKASLWFLIYEVIISKKEIKKLEGVVFEQRVRIEEFKEILLPRLPRKIEFAGTTIILDGEIRERVEDVFYDYLFRKPILIIYFKRSGRYFPYIEQKLRENNLPLDLKYLAVVESGLNPEAVSPKGAVGLWQFKKDTAKNYGLKVNKYVDERKDLERSTWAAIHHLKRLKRQFDDWFNVLAAYNKGEGRLKKTIFIQGVEDYFNLISYQETEKFIPRILAIKIIFSSPEKFGLKLEPYDFYKPLEYERVKIEIRHGLSVFDIAAAAGTRARKIKELNPMILNNHLPKGIYTLRLPLGTKESFERVYKIIKEE